MLAHVDMLLIESVRSSDLTSGGYTPANSVAYQWQDSVSFPCRCRRLLLPAKSGSCWKILVPDRSVSLVRELSARFCGVR
ncbi:hypothetical protein SLEP1_g18188 [Rubroshorea leprosula]|uniref:Uncharacterized protein n=1 Tax=Rubroshorea leprosula TaxID=152421 RepID=A0AAV5J274_9ROSI|nr:hypothetical protein SLEP1_g18188 [Rubroshorea leprosula]